MRLIDADKIVYSWQIDADGQEHDGVTLKSIIDKMPTHDATTLMQENINMRKIIHERVKNGRWEKIGAFLNGETVRCSKCGEVAVLNKTNRERYNFCPNCGADMRGTKE